MQRPKRQKRGRMFLILQVVSVLAVIVLGCFILASKVSAQGPKPVGSAAKGTPVAAPAAPTSSALAAGGVRKVPKGDAPAPVAAAAGDAGAADAPSDAGVAADASPLDYAVVQTDDDFPKGMSEEQKAAMGNGKVPIHREGPYRSPLAHPRFGGPATAKVGLVIDEIRDFDIQKGTFEAEFFLSMTGDKALPNTDITFPNGHEVTCDPLADAETFKLYRCAGSFTTAVDLRAYPFDTQELIIELEDKRAGVDQLIFEADPTRTSLNSEFRMTGYGVATVGARAYKHLYPPRFDRDDLYVSRYKFTLGIDRFATSAAFSVFVPAFIIVIISLMGLWVPPDELEVRSNAGAPMLAAAVLFHFSLIQALPATGYLTRADKLMLGVYVSLLLNMATTWAFLVVDEDMVETWFKRFRAWVPPLTVVVMALASMV
jgi:hypothetical protein